MGGVDIGRRRAANVVGPDWYQSGPTTLAVAINQLTNWYQSSPILEVARLVPVRARTGNGLLHQSGNSTYHVNQFKNRLDKHWKLHYIVFNYHTDFAETGGLA